MAHDNIFVKAQQAHEHHDHDHAHTANLQIVMTFVGGMLLIVAFVAGFIYPEIPERAEFVALLAAILLGIPLIIEAARDLLHGRTEMNELVALAVIAAIASGKYQEAGVIAFFMILGSLIEHRTALGARKSIEELVRITPTRATKLDGDVEVEVEAKDLKPGDRVRVRPGDNIPGDGRILTGSSSVNQANVTGESLPQDKTVGDDVFGGTISLTGVMDIEITKAGHDTTLGQVQDLILQAEKTRTPVMRLADQYARWYTPIVLMLAGMVYFFTKGTEDGLDRAIAMLIVACPCAIILSTPTAMVAALSAAARLGLLIKKVTDLEVARNLTAIVFDKTGTLTTGKLNVTRMRPVDGIEPEDLLRTAVGAEQNSRHPVARAIVEVAEKARVSAKKPTEFEEVSGRGVRAKIDGADVLVGRPAWLEEQGVDTSGVDTAGTEGLSLLYVARDSKVLGWVGLEDKTRTDAARAIDALAELGVRERVMLTGDRWSVARKVAAEMHCSGVKAEVLPGEKLTAVDQLRAAGHTVAVVGDGVNDAPALAAGDISIAMGAAGSDVAIHSASIALMNNNLNRIPFLVALSRRCFEVIRQNMVFAIAYVVLTLAFSAAGYVPPILAAFLHVASSIVVVFNSTRLVREGEDLDRQTYEEEQRRKRPTVQLEAVPAPA
ncbi:MAG: cadmium-translocating P-type ATPase [Phycisphaerae bacterium]|nr:cadmium-translocating P-type ATPase [Phycisphaerae bacterium]